MMPTSVAWNGAAMGRVKHTPQIIFSVVLGLTVFVFLGLASATPTKELQPHLVGRAKAGLVMCVLHGEVL
jgi:hypothetical protein